MDGARLIDFLSTFAMTSDGGLGEKLEPLEPDLVGAERSAPGGAVEATQSSGGAAAAAEAAAQPEPLRYAEFLRVLRTDTVLSRAVKRCIASAAEALATEQLSVRVSTRRGAASTETTASAPARVHAFLKQAESHVRGSELWRAALGLGRGEDGSEAAIHAALEIADQLEKLVMQRLYAEAFPHADPILAEQDGVLARRIRHLASFVRCVHLDVREEGAEYSAAWNAAAAQLARIDEFRAPRDKLVCIVNACNIVNGLLGVSRSEAHAGARSVGADDFLPALIYALLLANPPRLHANLAYIEAFRRRGGLALKAGYFLTALRSAADFVTTLTHRELSGIERADFDTAMARASAGDSGGRTDAALSLHAAERGSGEREGGSGAALPGSAPWRAARFRFVDTAEDELRLVDVPDLLREYKVLAATCDRLLLAGRGGNGDGGGGDDVGF